MSTLMTGYITHKVNDKVSIGGGIFTPFGMVSEWTSQWEGATVSYYSDLRTFCVNPVVSIQVHPRLSLAVGIDYLYSDFKMCPTFFTPTNSHSCTVYNKQINSSKLSTF